MSQPKHSKEELLKKMKGKWYVVQSNLEMWKTDQNPSIKYGKYNDGYVEDTVTRTTKQCCRGWNRSVISGWDKLLKEKNGKLYFKWRGTGFLFWVTSSWTLQIIGNTDGEEWAITTFEKTPFTTAGADYYGRSPTLSAAALKDIHELLKLDKDIAKYVKLNGGMFDCIHNTTHPDNT